MVENWTFEIDKREAQAAFEVYDAATGNKLYEGTIHSNGRNLPTIEVLNASKVRVAGPVEVDVPDFEEESLRNALMEVLPSDD